ncbi:hypothetical protein RchiOBHm_Chr6g0271191 [Rosa chinensis]|uniref:Uncharacterized protein n=1 Tax=Rosa chinensis TaxID=74649 RepID=A0A2P6PQX8_ROSCH|nr:hypothetical protein RchiOBHm_Chr6g0271191 [Rosa chinensis]
MGQPLICGDELQELNLWLSHLKDQEGLLKGCNGAKAQGFKK